MPEIEITEDQQEYLEDLRAELEADIVGPYGHVRISDAVQYLIDDHDGRLDDVFEESTGDVEAGEADDEDTNEADAEDDADETDTEDGADKTDTEDDADETDTEDDADKTDTEDDGDEDADEDEQGGEDRLSAMMSLLDTHDDKWREMDGDARYEVDLPDGTTEDAPTKDDVRAVLFKNY